MNKSLGKKLTSLLFLTVVLVSGYFLLDYFKKNTFNTNKAKAGSNITVESTKVILSAVRNIYGPSIFTNNGTKVFMLCGWRDENDPSNYLKAQSSGANIATIPGADKIWISNLNGDMLLPLNLSFKKNGYHVCDPSVVTPPSTNNVNRSKWLYMYYTGLENKFSSNSTDQIQNNVTGLATSVDGGQNWTDLGIILGRNKSGDGYGVWAASAVVSSNDIYVYYHTGSPNFSNGINFRQKLSANGWETIGQAERLVFYNDSGVQDKSILLSNVEVKKYNGTFYLVGNTLDLKKIVLYKSTDGKNFQKAASQAVIVDGGTNKLVAPNFEMISNNKIELYFGFAVGDGDSGTLHKWVISF